MAFAKTVKDIGLELFTLSSRVLATVFLEGINSKVQLAKRRAEAIAISGISSTWFISYAEKNSTTTYFT